MRNTRANAEAAVAAATAETQRRDAVRAAAERLDDARDVVVVEADIDVAAGTAAVARAAEAHIDLRTAVCCAEQRAGDTEAARAATAADALCRDRVRFETFGEDVGRAAHADVTGVAAFVAGAADAEVYIRRPADAASDAEAAIAAATANALRDDTVRAIAGSHDEVAEADRFDVAAVAATSARAADARTDRCTLRRYGAGDAEAAGAAATADALREDAVRIDAAGDDRAGAAHGNQIAVAATTTRAAETELRAFAFRDAGRDAETAVATTTADALREDAVGAIALCRQHTVDRCDVAEPHAASVTAAVTGAAEARVERAAIARHRARDAEATGAAATADALREDRVRFFAGGRDAAAAVERHVVAVTAAVTAAAKAEVRGRALADAARDAEAAVAATAADALRDQAVGARTQRCDPAAAVEQIDSRGIAPATAATADAGIELRVIGSDTASDGETTGATATTKTLREYRVRVVAARDDVARSRQPHRGADTAAVAGATEAEVRARTVVDAAGNREATVAATAADALREHAVCVVAGGVDDLRCVVQSHEAAAAAARARTADARAHVVTRDAARDSEAARAAATAETLREYAVRVVAVRDDGSAAVEQDVASEAATGAGAAQRERCCRTVGDAACDCEAAVAATTADALRSDAVRVTAVSFDRFRGAQHGDVLRVAAAVAFAAERDVHSALRRDAGGDREAARTTAAADALRENAVRVVALRCDARPAVHEDRIAVRTRAAVAADSQCRCRTIRDRSRNCKAAVAATAADALREQTDRAIALGRDHASVFRSRRDEDAAGVAAAVARAAECRADRAAARTDRARDAEAARAATAADALRKQAVRIGALRRDLTGARDEYVAADAGLRAVAAEAEVRRCTLRDLAHDGEAAVAAATADALRQQAVGVVACCRDRCASILDRHRVRSAATTTAAADSRADPAARVDAAGYCEAAFAATTADALCHQAVRVIAFGDDRVRRAHSDRVSVASSAALATDAQPGSCTERHRSRHAEAAGATAAAHALRDQAVRAIAARMNGAGRQLIDADSDGAGIAARRT